jgi:hypothetical protein
VDMSKSTHTRLMLVDTISLSVTSCLRLAINYTPILHGLVVFDNACPNI